MDIYSQFIHKSRYARFLPEKNRREHWEETVHRYIEYMESHVKEKHGFFDPALFKKLEQAIVKMEIMPSMRAMMTAGKALDRDNVAGYNCLAYDTEFVTRDGIKRLGDMVGETVDVLTQDGWKSAKVQHFGRQSLQLVTFRPTKSKSNVRHHIKVTPDHRWLTMQGWTTNLKVGDAVPSVVVASHKKNDEAWVRGFGFGDGTIDARGKARVRLCGSKNNFLDTFLNLSCSKNVYTQSMNGDHLVVFNGGAFTNWKNLPIEHLDDLDYLYSWLCGYLAADGHHDPVQPGISSQDVEAVEFVKKIAPLCGYVVTGHNVLNNTTNFGERSAPLHRLTLRSEAVFYVTNIEPLDEDEVFCVTEPVTQSFTLANGILTGNCSYLPVDDPKAFDEAMFILMCGTGVGFSVERQYVNQLPEIPDEIYDSDTVIHVKDSKEGWAKALRMLIALLYSGEAPRWDTTKIRPEGAVLKTFGGRASGPQPLEDLFKFVVKTFKNAVGRRLTSLECHDIMCKIGEVVVVGGVRRSAMISLSNLSDERMRNAKSGAWWEANIQRALSNNSAVYTEKPDVGMFMKEWLSLYESKSGERGIFSRDASQRVAKKNGRRDADHDFGTNPCSEIILRPYQFCNLTEVVVRAHDTEETLIEKVKLATILGTFQSTLTHFPYLRKIWQKNTEEERLLGVSLTGIYDSRLLNNPHDKKLPTRLESMREAAVATNKEFADKLGINQSAAITCVKPSGTVSQLTDSASGIHPRHDHNYYRRVRADNKDPLTQYLINIGVPHEADITKPHSTTVFTFPQKAPKGAVVRSDVSSIDHLELWLVFQRHWCEHKPSVTISVKEEEWPRIGAWVYDHFDEMSGVSFLPWDGGNYRQSPYETVGEKDIADLQAMMPTKIDWDALIEGEDNVEGVQTLACSAGGCEI